MEPEPYERRVPYEWEAEFNSHEELAQQIREEQLRATALDLAIRYSKTTVERTADIFLTYIKTGKMGE